MSEIELYRGVSSEGIEKILTEGITPYETKYDEARSVLSKYVNPDILTDDFLEENKDFIGTEFGLLSYRFGQFTNGGGLFYTKAEHFSDEELEGNEFIKKAIERRNLTSLGNVARYARSAATEFPEYERYIVRYLNSLSYEELNTKGMECKTARVGVSTVPPITEEELQKKEKELRCYAQILTNMKSEYVRDGQVKISPPANNYPVILRVNGNNKKQIYDDNVQVRIVGALRPEEITGVAFAPENPSDRPVFLTKEEFLKQLQERKEKDKNAKNSTLHQTLKQASLEKENVSPSNAVMRAKLNAQKDI